MSDKVKGLLLKSKFVKKLNNDLKLKRFYGKGSRSAGGQKRILFWSTGGMVIQTNLEGAIAAALKLRGHKVKVILCDGIYKACAKRVDMPEVRMEDWGKYCNSCIRQNARLLEKLGIEYAFLSDLVSKEKAAQLRKIAECMTFSNYRDLKYGSLHLGSHLESAMMRHTKGGPYDGLEKVLVEYAYAVLINAEAASTARTSFKPTGVYMSHGIYADWGPALAVFIKNKIPVTSYICCYLTAHFFFGTVKHFEETFLAVTDRAWKKFVGTDLTGEQKSRLNKFLDNRYKNMITHDMKGLLKEYKGHSAQFYEKYGLDSSKPVWGVMTHINWDAVSDYFPMIHKNFDEWLYETINVIKDVRDVQWLIKIHPSELNDNPDTGCQRFIEKNFPELPSHVKVLKMDDDISPLDFYNLLDGAVTVMGTGGLEISIKGKPVILAGEAHYSGKGFTHDAKDREHYEELLRRASGIKALDDDRIALAWKYAYIYFIRKQIPLLPAVTEELLIDFKNLSALIPGKSRFIDFICERIIDGEDFIMPDELVKSVHLTDKEQIRNFA